MGYFSPYIIYPGQIVMHRYFLLIRRTRKKKMKTCFPNSLNHSNKREKRIHYSWKS